MNHLYFAKSVNGIIPRGSVLSAELSAVYQSPVIAKEFEALKVQGQNYLLADKEPIEFKGSLQTGSGNNHYFQKSNITYRYNENFELLEVSPNWLQKGTETNKGIVVELGDEIAICKNGSEPKPYFKKSLLPVESERELVNQELEALEYRGRLYKSLTGVKAQPKTGGGKFQVSFAGPKAQIVPTQEHTEGEIRQFSANDTRQLTRAKSGVLRWLSVDEKMKLQQAKQKAQLEESKVKERQKYEEGTKNKGTLSKLFRIGKEILVGGTKSKVVDYGDDIIAVQKPDGTTTTVRASEYNPEQHKSPETNSPKHSTESPEITAKTEREIRSRQKSLETDVHESIPRNKYYVEQQAIIKEQSALPEYQKFQSEQEKDGWTRDIATPFRFVKDISFVSSMGNLRSGTAEKVWRPEKKDYDYYFEGEGFNVTYQGKEYRITGMNDKNIDIKDQFGNAHTIKNDELDQYKGQIILDAEGNARIKNAQGEEFSLELNEGLSQEDLFKEGIVKIIKDEVWKSIKNGEGAVVDDIKLGKIRRGITFYKHGNEAGIIDENKHQHQVDQHDAKRDIPELDEKLKGLQKEVNKEREKLDKKNLERQDVETVKARIEHGNQNVPYASKGKGLDSEKYKDVFDQWLKDGGEGIDEQIAGSYANPDEWKANVLSLAERMKVEDVKRASEVTALNDFAKTGIIIEPPKPKEMEAYLETAKETLMARRKDFLRTKQTEKDETAKFDWDEPAELPSADSGAIVSDNVKVIRDSRNDSYQVQYAFVPKNNIVASNDISGKANEEHPTELQARERSQDEASNLQMRKIAAEPNEELVEDNKDATRGAPVAYSKGGKTYIVQGNGRAGAVAGMEGAGKEKYFGMMLQKAKELGIPTDKVNDDMMLVRVLSPVHTYEDARKLGAFGQKSSALPMTEVEEARSFQNAQRLKFGLNLNLAGIGRRSINEKNVGNFIRNNPQVYQKILKLSGYDPIAVQYRPAEQAKVVNTALLAQLDKDFIRTVSRKGEDTHELVKVTAPIIADNQKDIADGAVPPNGDIQKFLKNSIEQYDGLSSTTKNLLKVDKNGNIPFLETGDEGRKNPDSLISRMRQEAIEFGDKKSGNIFRNPLNVIGLVAYNQAMTPRDPDKKDQARELFALKMKRFADAMKTLKENKQQGGDIFAAQLSPEQQTAQEQEDIIKIAERVFLENKPYREENAEEMTAEEKEAGKETYSAFNAYKKMKDVAKEFEFDLEHHKLKKSLLGYFFKSMIQKQYNEVKQFKTDQLNMFGAQEEHHIGDTKTENGIKYTLLETTIGKPRWHTQAEIEAMKAGKTTIPEKQPYEMHKEEYIRQYFKKHPNSKRTPNTLAMLEQHHRIQVEGNADEGKTGAGLEDYPEYKKKQKPVSHVPFNKLKPKEEKPKREKGEFYKVDDDIVGEIHKMEGFNDTHGINANVFAERVEVIKGFSKEKRYFPQIKDYENEETITIGDTRKGYKSLSEAKQALKEELSSYLKSNAENIKKHYGSQYDEVKKDEPSQVHGNMIEYATQELFKQKGKKSADKVFKAVAEKFDGKENMFLGGKVSINAEQLKNAVYDDKIKTFNERYKDAPDKIEAAIEPFVSYFNLDEKEFRERLNPKAKRLVKSIFSFLFKSQQNLFGNAPISNKPKRKEYNPDISMSDPQAGQIKKFAEGDTRILKPAALGKIRWFDYAGEQKKKEAGLFENIPEAEPKQVEKKEETKQKQPSNEWIKARAKYISEHPEKAITGKNGNKLIAYEHKKTQGEKFSKREGGLVAGMVSDWDNAEECEACGRHLVHVYYVEDKNGKVKPYGSEHLYTALGYDKDYLTENKIDKMTQKLLNDQKHVEEQYKFRAEELMKRSSKDIDEVNKLFWRGYPKPMLAERVKPEETELWIKEDGMMVRIHGESKEDKSIILGLGFHKKELKPIRTKEYRDRQQAIDSQKQVIEITKDTIESLTDAVENPAWEESRKEYAEDAKENVKKLAEAKKALKTQESELDELESVHKKETEIEDRQEPIFAGKAENVKSDKNPIVKTEKIDVSSPEKLREAILSNKNLNNSDISSSGLSRSEIAEIFKERETIQDAQTKKYRSNKTVKEVYDKVIDQEGFTKLERKGIRYVLTNEKGSEQPVDKIGLPYVKLKINQLKGKQEPSREDEIKVLEEKMKTGFVDPRDMGKLKELKSKQAGLEGYDIKTREGQSNRVTNFSKFRKSLFPFFKSQMDMFGAPKQPTQPKPAGGLSWKSLGQEKPNHKYIRRERGKSGEWVYYYQDAQGREFKGDAKGKELPKHYNWKQDDTVIHDGKKYSLDYVGNEIAVVYDQDGNNKVVRIAELTHESEHQKKLVQEHETKWDRLVSALEADLKQFEQTGKSVNYPEDTKLELQRKLKYAQEERDQRKGNSATRGSQDSASESTTQGSGEATIPEKKSYDMTGKELGTLYHGGKQKIDNVDLNKVQARDSGFYGKGFYATKKPDYAKTYGNKISSLEPNPDAKALIASLNPNEAPKGLLNDVIDFTRKSGEGKAKERGKLNQFNEELSFISKNPLEWKNAVDKYARDNEYDIVKYSDGEIVGLNDNAFKKQSPNAVPSGVSPKESASAGTSEAGSTSKDQTSTPEFKKLSELLGSPILARDVISVTDKTLMNSLNRCTNVLTDFLKSSTITSHSTGNIDIPSSVMSHVFDVTKNAKILDSIVRLLPVDVMDFLKSKQLPAEKLFHDKAMFKDIFTVNADSSITSNINIPVLRSLISSIADTTAKIASLTKGTTERIPTGQTDTGNLISSTHNNDNIINSPAFSKWFGDSKVVDKKGKPLKVFHGTRADFTEFETSAKSLDDSVANRLGDNIGAFFTTHSTSASDFALRGELKGQKPTIADINDENIEASTGAQVTPVYLSLKNPKIFQTQQELRQFIYNEEHTDEKFNNVINARTSLEKDGYDGIIVKNSQYGGKSSKEKWFITFSPSQIKSAIGNKGTFDPENADITKSIFSNAREWFKQLTQARKETDTNPTEKQKEAGNYAKGEINLYGLKISIENPKGSIRRGKDKGGNPWECKLHHDYGYINGTEGKDKDHLDAFIGSDKDAKNVYIVNQIDPETKKFDEHKILVLMRNKRTAIRAYNSNYADDASKRIHSIIEMSIEEFKKWIESGNHKVKAV